MTAPPVAPDPAAVSIALARLHPVPLARLFRPSYRPAAIHWAIGDALVELERGVIDRLMVFVPPRHGKSELVSIIFPAWYLGRHPDRRVIAASYGADLTATWGRQARNILGSEEFGEVFPGVGTDAESAAADRWDIAGHRGGYIGAGVGGPITGRGANVLIVDDPVKNLEEAESPTYREATWEWYTTVAYPRLEPPGAIILIMTRWHEDDLAGRLLAAAQNGGDKWRVLSLPAVAGTADPLGRPAGAALWPARYDVDELERIRLNIGGRPWSALYQQSPQPDEGAIFTRRWFTVLDAAPKGLPGVRYWDLAASKEKAGTDPDWTAGCLMRRDREGRFYIEEVTRMRATPAELESVLRMTAAQDGQSVSIWIEEEPGSAGKQLVDYLRRHVLPGYAVHSQRVTGTKTVRAAPLAAQAEAGNVMLVRGPWHREFLDELEHFPVGAHDDQVDAAAGAYLALAAGAGAKYREYPGPRME